MGLDYLHVILRRMETTADSIWMPEIISFLPISSDSGES